MGELKQVIVVRNDIKMSRGKTAAQVAHASLEAALSSNKKLLSNWRTNGAKKITLKVDSLEELKEIYKKAQEANLTASLITDAGHTELPPNTTTCLAIGPDAQNKIDLITGDLKNL